MIKMTTVQAKALANKINKNILDDYYSKVKEYRNELKKSKEYDIVRSDIADLMNDLLDFSAVHDCDLVGMRLVLFNTSYNYDMRDVDTDENFEKWVDHYAEGWITKKVNKKYTRPYIKLEELIDDIILEALCSEDINAIITKFSEKYGKNITQTGMDS